MVKTGICYCGSWVARKLSLQMLVLSINPYGIEIEHGSWFVFLAFFPPFLVLKLGLHSHLDTSMDLESMFLFGDESWAPHVGSK